MSDGRISVTAFGRIPPNVPYKTLQECLQDTRKKIVQRTIAYATNAERAKVVAWLRKGEFAQIADMIEAGQHDTE